MNGELKTFGFSFIVHRSAFIISYCAGFGQSYGGVKEKLISPRRDFSVGCQHNFSRRGRCDLAA
ncbi:MAG TPA: hypothetical protein VN256_05075 [Pyrinomonadaceae bacterium]|nr:hypothetical protein [Pyrinomonadaceae bacterium]